ncbi:hypothetical protein [uncultured Polaribacter sp.]|uniref:hypothetical protein n=1 Tax=uncultured Polaribacter sp. TaxID=174711 RepID=UPI002636867B|nr:hypothetical protein [uncultured Polaribacter sp.]
MKNKFWIEEKSPKLFFKEFILSENPKANFWNIFKSYDPDYSSTEPADLDEEWLRKQDKIVNKIIQKHFAKIKLNRKEIELLIDAIEEYTLPEEDQYTEDLYSKFKEIAKNIAKNYILPLKLKQSTVNNLINKLEDQLKNLNESHIIESDKEAIRQSIRLKKIIGEYSKEKSEEILQNFEKMWSIPTETNEAEYKKIEEDNDVIEIDDFIYPRFPLASSTTFYGFNGDGGNLSYEEQEEFVNKKFNQYKVEISELINQQPDKTLQPKLDYTKLHANEDLDTIYWNFIKANPFMHEFEGNFVAWKGTKEVLFLSVSKEDKELPYDIIIGGLTLSKYYNILKKYNSITNN